MKSYSHPSVAIELPREIDTIHFDMGTKRPKIIIEGFDYLILKREVNRTIWMCSKYFGTRTDRCIIYFDVGLKNPKIRLDNYDYIIYRKELNKTVWKCSKYFPSKGTIYFDVGVKNPKLILDGGIYRLYKKKPNKTIWLCNQYYLNDKCRCKSRIVTSGRIAHVYGKHNHEMKQKRTQYQDMLSQNITIIRHPEVDK
ncbi:hypothetical protein WA026_007540 [Henosepilachna vigintioctopunctata]|uniref:FLYWCH-type domain-containing protein n=1 Tax=Henosepilachna vigintioctopunctata TaxID=420089 RepID=A0AAW1UUZ8_9CUCU